MTKDLIYIDDFVKTDFKTLIWAPSNSGKSILALYFAIAIAYQLSIFIFKVKKARKVAIIDAETPQDLFKTRLKPLRNQYKIDENVKDNLYLMSIKGNKNFQDFDILKVDWQKKLLSIWKKMKIEVVVLDNIIALTKRNSDSPATIKEIFSFVTQIENAGIAVILIHHSNKQEKVMKGTYELQAQSQNIIQVFGKRQLKEMKELSTSVRNALTQEGQTLAFTIDESKVFPNLEGQTFYFYCAENTGIWQRLYPDIEQEEKSNILDGLHPKALQIYELINAKKSTRKNIEMELKWCGKTILKYLNQLKDLDLIDTIGEGQNRCYRKRKA